MDFDPAIRVNRGIFTQYYLIGEGRTFMIAVYNSKDWGIHDPQDLLETEDVYAALKLVGLEPVRKYTAKDGDTWLGRIVEGTGYEP